VGLRVTVRSVEEVAGALVHEGWLRDVDDEGIALEIDGESRRIQHSAIASARTVVDWAAELKGSRT
jgi:ribosome maturation factor RimP